MWTLGYRWKLKAEAEKQSKLRADQPNHQQARKADQMAPAKQPEAGAEGGHPIRRQQELWPKLMTVAVHTPTAQLQVGYTAVTSDPHHAVTMLLSVTLKGSFPV